MAVLGHGVMGVYNTGTSSRLRRDRWCREVIRECSDLYPVLCLGIMAYYIITP